MNSFKLRNDAKKFAFIDALSHYNVNVILPYGNIDSTYKGKIKSVNLLSLASNAKVFSALDQSGQRLPGFPYSPLSSGDETAIYNIRECPQPDDPFKARLDINSDGYFEYTFVRTGEIAHNDPDGQLSFAPAVIAQEKFYKWLAQFKRGRHCRINDEVVLTAGQFREVKSGCRDAYDL